jgi:hypothetical protein
MDVRFGYMRNLHVVLPGDLQIRIYIALGIDYQGYARFLTAYKIAGLRERLIVNVLKKHSKLLFES